MYSSYRHLYRGDDGRYSARKCDLLIQKILLRREKNYEVLLKVRVDIRHRVIIYNSLADNCKIVTIGI